MAFQLKLAIALALVCSIGCVHSRDNNDHVRERVLTEWTEEEPADFILNDSILKVREQLRKEFPRSKLIPISYKSQQVARQSFPSGRGDITLHFNIIAKVKVLDKSDKEKQASYALITLSRVHDKKHPPFSTAPKSVAVISIEKNVAMKDPIACTYSGSPIHCS